MDGEDGKTDGQTVATAVVAAVLAGGKGRRLGQDKAGLVFSGQTLLARNLALLTGLVEKVWISGRQASDLAGWQLPAACRCLPDLRPGQGPLGGLVSLLRKTGCACLVLPVDLPFMRPELLRSLLAARAEGLAGAGLPGREAGDRKREAGKNAGPGPEDPDKEKCGPGLAVTQFVHATGKNKGRQEHLVAIYEQAALDWLEPCLASGKLKLGLAIPEKARHLVPIPSGQEDCFLNINTMQDLEKARKPRQTGKRQTGKKGS